MPQNQNGLTKTEYLRFRDRYVPERRKIVFVLESPPASGRYFYNPEGAVSEPLFHAMMKDVLGTCPQSKAEGLSKFVSRGFLLIDATYTPVNHLSARDRDAVILDDFPVLVRELHKYAGPETSIVLVKANVCELLELKLTSCGFTVLNRGTKIPFPSSGQQGKFGAAIRLVLGSQLL